MANKLCPRGLAICDTGRDLTNRYRSSALLLTHSKCRAAGLVVELGGSDSAPGGLGSGVQAPVPNGDDQAAVADCQSAGQMDSVGSA